MNKRRVIAISVIVLVLCAGCWKFLDIYNGAKTHFPENTYVNGVDCSGLSLNEAEEKLTEEWDSRDFHIRYKGRDLAVIDLDCGYDIAAGLRELMDPNPFVTVFNALRDKKHEYELSMEPAGLTAGMKKQIASLEFLDADYDTKTRNAYVELEDRRFRIIKEVYGNNIDKGRFIAGMDKNIAAGRFSLEYRAKDYYDLPEVKADDPELAERREWCRENLSQIVTYRFYDGDRTLIPKEINRILRFGKDGEKSINKENLKEFVTGLAMKHNTAYSNRRFRTRSGRTVTLYGGNYGWMLDQKKEVKRLSKVLLGGKDAKLDPFWQQEPYYAEATRSDDIGSSYVEVSISRQRVWLVKNGQTVLSSPVVTGKLAGGHGTPGGTYRIAYMQRDTKLRGFEDDGTPYSNPVSYWMPFNGDIGLHDASWRHRFGGSIYKKGGSHGCINMPVGAARSLYSMIETGFPVVVY